MIALLIITVLCLAFGILAARYGHDSREGFGSKEAEFAAYGMTWQDREE